MSYHKLENIDEAIVKATIAIGGTRKASRGFAVRDIAQRCGISEYVIFHHFTNKQNLMAIADKRVGYLLSSEARTLRKTSSDFDRFFFRYLDWLLAHKEIVYFSLNFGHAVPHSTNIPIPDLQDFNRVIEEDAKAISLLPNDAPKNQQTLAWKFFLRNTLYFAGFFLAKTLDDNAESRAWIRQVIYHGIASFPQKEVANESA